MRDWVGGKVFGGQAPGLGVDGNEQFLDWAHQLAQTNNAIALDPVIFADCISGQPLDSCQWDPRVPQVDGNDQYHADNYNEFRGPDQRRYAFATLTDRNQIVVVDRDRNTASYVTVRNYNQLVIASQDDGSSGAFQLELPIKYTLDFFDQYN